ncbi:MAG: hypothetical protein EOO04_01215 [Chitinophagaceae bacterium]|nr:MAG: hypothetical protein EOO04_01215 [Chitinophagaceae bacterium]
MRLRYIYGLLILCLLSKITQGQELTALNKNQLKFNRTILASDLEDPWCIEYGSDGHLWVAEAKGYRVLRIKPQDSTRRVVADLNSERKFPRYDTVPDEIDGGKPWPQGGLMGMALHPQLTAGKPYVYLAFVYEFEGVERSGKGAHPKDSGFHFLTKIVRYQFDTSRLTLGSPVLVCDSIPSSNDHNGGRLAISRIGTTEYLFYSAGDMGAGQFDNAGRKNNAQDPIVYEGKILRFFTEPESGKPGKEAWIPADNPFNTNRRNAVWSTGHRNPQGLVSMKLPGRTVLMASEHGPYSDDEISIITRAGNSGHPLVIGYADGNYNGLAAGTTDKDRLPGKWNTTYPLIVNEKSNAGRIKNYQEPIISLYPTSHDSLLTLMQAFQKGDTKDKEWESLAPSGIAAYSSDAIPGWQNSILVTSLKQGIITRLQLNAKGTKVTFQETWFKAAARYRDITISTDGKTIFVVTDRSQVTSGPSKQNSKTSELTGAVIAFTFDP